VLPRDDHHAIARRKQLFDFKPDTFELPEDANVVVDHGVTTTVDASLRRTRVGVELDLGMEKWPDLGTAACDGIDSPSVKSLVRPSHDLHVLLRHRPRSIPPDQESA
jgi:hypothetical protein